MRTRRLWTRPRWLSLFAPVALGACTDATTVRVGPAVPSLPPDCPLELVEIAPGTTPPGLELLGYVRIIHDEGRGSDDREVLKLVRPEACKLGGERVSAGMSSNFSNGCRSGSSNLYAVWRQRRGPALR